MTRYLIQKYLLMSLALLVTSVFYGQNAFEGEIDYKLESTDSSIQVGIHAWFSKGRIRFDTRVIKAPTASDMKSESIIIHLDSAYIDRIKTDDKKVEREWLRGKFKKQDIPDLKFDSTHSTILGIPCQGFTTGHISKEEMEDSVKVLVELEVKFWYAEQLFFPVPDSIKMVQMIPLFTNGRIAMGSLIKVSKGPVKLTLKTTAVDLRPAPAGVPELVFRLPPGYPLIHKQ